MSKVGDWKAECSSSQVASSVQEAESLLKKHHELSDDISQIYAEVMFYFMNFFQLDLFVFFLFIKMCNACTGIQYIFVSSIKF